MESPDRRRNRNSRNPGPCDRHAATGAPQWRAPTNAATETAADPEPCDRHAATGASQWRAPTNAATGQPGPTCRSRNRMTGWPLPEQPQPECRGPETMLPEGRSPLPRRRPKTDETGYEAGRNPLKESPGGAPTGPKGRKRRIEAIFFGSAVQNSYIYF